MTKATRKNDPDRPTQISRFKEAARALGCDESEERFDAALKKVAVHKPPKDRKDRTAKAKNESSQDG
jgi:hypothetical protein